MIRFERYNTLARFFWKLIVTGKRTTHDRKCAARLQAFTVTTAAALLLTACSGGASGTFNDYQQRLERLLDTQAEAAETYTVTPMPRVQHVRVTPEEVSISLLDSMRLSSCELGQLVSERNSSLGKVRSPSAQLYYELRLIPAMHDCLNNDTLSERLAQDIQQALRTKIKNLPLVIHNFITTDEAFRGQFRSSTRTLAAPLTTRQYEELNTSVSALKYFAKQLKQGVVVTESAEIEGEFTPYQIHSPEWHTQLRHIGQLTALSRFWQSQRYSISRMQQLTALLKNTEQLDCPQGRPSEQARYLANVMTQIYVPNIQTTLSQLENIGRQLEPLLLAYGELTVNTAWADYLQELNDLHHQLRMESQHHAQEWQRLLTPCSLQPQAVI